MSSVHRRRVLILRSESAISVNKWDGSWTVTVVELPSLPIASVNVKATNDHGRNWCQHHSDGEGGIWHNCCARVRACQWVAGCVDIPMCYRLSPKWMPNGCFGKNDAIVFWTTSYATNASMTKTTRLLMAKAWIGSPIIAVNAEPSNVSLNKLSPTGNGRNPWREAPKAWIHMWNIYVTSMVIRVWYSSHSVTLEPSPSRPWPSPTWTPPCLLSLGTHFI